MTRTEYLRAQALSGANKCCRTPLPRVSFKDESCSISERKAKALRYIFENMPIYIGKKELIVGTRTFFTPNKGNEDGHDVFQYQLSTCIPYVNERDIERFGCNQEYMNKTHYTPDFGIILNKGIDAIIEEAENKKNDASLKLHNVEFLSSVVIAYTGLKNMILRYSQKAAEMAAAAEEDEKAELLEIAEVCENISAHAPKNFREAVQLLWFAHLGTIIESFQFVTYGRLDVILDRFLGDTPTEEAQQIIECLLLKMYDQADLVASYLGKYSAQLVVTLGGVLPNGENAVNRVTMMFLDAVDKIRLPEPEFNLRLSSKNPPDFLDRAAELSVSGCNFISYYNDDLFVESLHQSGIPLEYARDYGFDLCQDINIPGKGDFWLVDSTSLANVLLDLLEKKRDFSGFDQLIKEYKAQLSSEINDLVEKYNVGEKQLSLYAEGKYDEYFDAIKNQKKPADRNGSSPMSPLPLLSALYHGSVENALDVIFEPYPIKSKGFFVGVAVEGINALSAIKKTVFEDKTLTLDEIYTACLDDFAGQRGEIIRNMLWNCPKWGNDDDYVDLIGKEILEFAMMECNKHKTYLGAEVLGGIHQPHPVHRGSWLMAIPNGRHAKAPVAVTLTPESGSAHNGATAILNSASKIDPMLVKWNFCVQVNYFASVFGGNEGKEIFKTLLNTYFEKGGLQHQPNVLDVEELKRAQLEPEKYKDLIVRLWGVSAHFVDLPCYIQDELISRF